MLLQLLAAIVAAASVQQGSGDLQHDVQAIQSNLQHLFQHDMDLDSDGVTTIDEARRYFHLYDHGDCLWTYSEFKATQAGGHGVNTEEQHRAMFFFYDTRGCSQAADGLFTCDDIPLLFGILDADNDGQLSRAESETGSRIFAQHMAAIIPTGTCPTMASG